MARFKFNYSYIRHEKLGDNNKAYECYVDAIRIYPGDTLLYKNLIYVYVGLDENEKALHEVESLLLRLDFTEKSKRELKIDFYCLKGFVLEKLNRSSEAIDAYKKAMTLNRSYFYPYWVLAELSMNFIFKF
jgi:tetratricopeptide (TPR) repeat protein